jgi:hypothetical protein
MCKLMRVGSFLGSLLFSVMIVTYRTRSYGRGRGARGTPELICCFSPMLICATFGFSSLRTWASERMVER